MNAISTAKMENQLLASVLETMPVGIVLVNDQGKIILVNSETERLFAYSRQEIIGKSIEILLPERFREMHVGSRCSYTERPVSRAMGVGSELFGRKKDGQEFPVEIGLSPISTSDGPAVVASIVDISEHKRFERNFRAIMEASPYGKLIIDENGNIVLTNERLVRLFGYQTDELIGQSIEKLIPERIRESHSKYRKGFFSSPSLRAMGVGRDLTGLHKNGTEIPLEIGLNPVESAEGTMVIAAVIDISERKRIEQDLRQAHSNLEEFTYVASHDLRSPLRGITDLVDWITEDLGDAAAPSVKQNLARVSLRIKRMERMIEDLLEYARAGRASPELVDIQIPNMIEDILELHPCPPAFSIKSKFCIQNMKAARTPLETSLRNLISNALKHHDKEEGNIIIEVDEDDAYAKFSIIDDGPGIPKNAQERIFRLFQTLTSSERGGSGIGLALTKRLVESHGGRITVESDGGRGTAFHFWWPRFPRKGYDG